MARPTSTPSKLELEVLESGRNGPKHQSHLLTFQMTTHSVSLATLVKVRPEGKYHANTSWCNYRHVSLFVLGRVPNRCVVLVLFPTSINRLLAFGPSRGGQDFANQRELEEDKYGPEAANRILHWMTTCHHRPLHRCRVPKPNLPVAFPKRR